MERNKADRHKSRTRNSKSHFAEKKLSVTDRRTDRPNDRHSGLQSRVHATKKGAYTGKKKKNIYHFTFNALTFILVFLTGPLLIKVCQYRHEAFLALFSCSFSGFLVNERFRQICNWNVCLVGHQCIHLSVMLRVCQSVFLIWQTNYYDTATMKPHP